MRYSRCMQAEQQLATLSTTIHPSSTHLVYELGETLYSGPASLAKSELSNHVNSSRFSSSETAVTTTTTLPQKKTCPGAEKVSSKDKDEKELSNGLNGFTPKDIATKRTTTPKENASDSSLKVNCNKSDPCVENDNAQLPKCNGDVKSLKKKEIRATTQPVQQKDLCVRKCKTKKEMVRLIQEPSSKVDPHCLRRGMRAPKRIQSVDGLDLSDRAESRKPKSGCKELRNRSVSCGSEPSDSELSDCLLAIDEKSQKAASDEENGIKVNGQMNGIAKTQKVSRANSEDSSDSGPNYNGLDIDNDRVDINLLLEISPKDRKIFENKKAKIKRKFADWMLITEAEQYYNEKEEILRNKTREDSDSEEEIKSKVSTENCKNKPKKSKGPPPKIERKPRSNISDQKEKLKVKANRPKKCDLSNDEDSEHDCDLQPPPRGRNCKKNPKPSIRKRLSDAERFLRDNKEYYQFPETRDRLRKNPQSRETTLEDEDSDASDKANNKRVIKPKTPPCSPPPNSTKRKTKNTKRRPTTDSEQEETPPDQSAMEGLYFSFEGPPVKESWYQTYQRYIDGIQEDHFQYEKEAFQFVLPYEMPKDYFKELYGRKFLLSRRRTELAELVRKSPRCHASTLALFSDIFPETKKKKKKKVVGKVAAVKVAEEHSSDGASTPNLEPIKLPLGESYETEEELLFIGQCMDQVIKTAIDVPVEGDEEKKTKLKDPKKKKKVKNKKVVTCPVLKEDKYEFPEETKIFDNSLAAEIDTRFLQELPQYLQEGSLSPRDTLEKNYLELLSESCHCECTERTSCDELSSADERTEASSENLSVCDSETRDSCSSSFPPKLRKFGPYKKRRKNMTGWPTQKRKRPAHLHVSDDNDSCASQDEPKKQTHPKCSEALRRASTRKRSSVYYMDTWPVRFRNTK